MTARENLLRTIRHQDPAWIPDGMESTLRLYPPILERPLTAGLDAFGVAWDLEPGAEGGTFPAAVPPVIPELARWRDHLKIPDVDRFDWSYVAEQVKNLDREQILFEGFCEMGLFERSYLLLGMEAALVGYLTDPAAMRELLETLADYKIAFLRRFDDAVDLDMVWYGDDWGTQTDLFVPETAWREVIKPPTRRIYAFLKEREVIINQHSCGKIEKIFADVVEMGADVWNLCQPCNDLAALKRRHGRSIAFHGGIDSQFVLNRPGATPDEVEAEVRRRVAELAEGGGYIAGPSHTVPSHRPELLRAYHAAVAAAGRRAAR